MRKALENIWVKRVFLVVLSYLCVLSAGKIVSLHGGGTVFFGGDYFGYNLGSVFMFGGTIWLMNRFLRTEGKRRKAASLAGGFLLSAAIVYGAYAHYVNDIFRSVGETFLQFGLVIGIGFLTVPLSSEFFGWMERGSGWLEKHYAGRPQLTGKRAWLYFVLIWLGIFVCYLPVFLAFWPGNFVFDAQYQMQNVIEGYHSTHHPLLHTLLMGYAYQFGQARGDVSWGYQFYTLFQMLVLSSSFAYLILYLYRKQAPKCICIASFFWFALFPMHSVFSISATKDVLCAAFFLYFAVFLVRLVYDKEKFCWYSYAGMIFSGMLLSLFRNNALYSVLITGVIVVLAAKGWKQKGRILGIFAAIFVLSCLANHALIAHTNAQDKDSYRETLCVPLQCLARVASYRRADISQELYDEICLYIQEADIGTYSPYLADNVKNNANEELLRSNTVNFLKLWLKTGLQFPGEYLESIITNTLGYWYPLNQGRYVSAELAIYHTLIGMGDEIVKQNYCKWAEKIYSYFFWTTNYNATPLLAYAFRNAPYIWLNIFYMLWCFVKKNGRAALIGVLPLVYLFTCLCGPMAALRYVYSIVVCVPLVLFLLLKKNEQKQTGALN